MIPGMFFVTWEDMGTNCDKVNKIVGIFFCNNTFVLSLTTMEKYNVQREQQTGLKILKYQDQAGMVRSWYQTNTQSEL